ncbi:MAG: hydantoinase/oxoprolinase family protein [Rhodobacteraceae bacterium]|nr:hydantoinase/oxoprolinase family protein [Paracoccaceae bacterium]
MAGWIVGVDVGGTFTDFSARNLETGAVRIHKRPSTPDDPSRAILHGLGELQAKAGIAGADIVRFAHGTTVATNALLQRRGATIRMITTRGFRDLVEIGRQVRPMIYDLQVDAPPPLVARSNRLEVTERIGPRGEIITPLTAAEIDRVVAELARGPKAESIAICLLFSFLNPVHEQRLADAIRAAMPELSISVSSEVQPEFREYERFSTTLINAFLQPEVGRYMKRLKNAVAGVAPAARFGIFQSSGGLMSADKASEFPVRTALSGPAAGAVGAAAAGAAARIRNIITLDIGGTSTDVCLIRGGQTEVAHIRDIAGFRIRLPMVDIHTVGAGGGSIAFIGPDGLLKVGPESAGAVPGPACFGRGGDRPTVSDANVVLGRLPDQLAGGELSMDPGRALEAIRTVAEPLGISAVKAALGICGIASSNMMRAIRAVSTEKGYDPRHFALMAFGGAGGLHATDVARSLGIRRVVVPPAPGILCAAGLLDADLQENYVVTCRTPLDGDLSAIDRAVAELDQQARAWIAAEAAGAERAHRVLTLDMRHVGQNYELSVTLERITGAPPPPLEAGALKEAFFAEHLRSYGHVDRDAPVEIVNIRMKAVARLRQATATVAAPVGPGTPVEHHDVWFDEDQPRSTPIYARSTLEIGFALRGPAIITQFDATTLVPPSATMTVDPVLNLILELDDA